MAFSDKSCLFDGVDEYVTMGDVLDFDRTDAFSISLWVKTSDTGVAVLVGKRGGGPAWLGYDLTINGSGYLSFALCNDDATSNKIVVNNGSGAWRDDIWHHVVISYSGSSAASGVVLYIDGVAQTPTVVNDGLSASTLNSSDFEIARRSDGTSYVAANIDELAIYDKELSAAEVVWLWNGRDPQDLADVAAPSNLVGWWRMADGDTYPTLTDNSVNTNDGTMTNMEVGDIVDDAPAPHYLTDVDFEPVGQVRNPVKYVNGVKTSDTLSLFYRMRGIDITCPAVQQPAYVYWTVETEPDYTAALLSAGALPCGTDPLTDVADISIAGSWEVLSSFL